MTCLFHSLTKLPGKVEKRKQKQVKVLIPNALTVPARKQVSIIKDARLGTRGLLTKETLVC